MCLHAAAVCVCACVRVCRCMCACLLVHVKLVLDQTVQSGMRSGQLAVFQHLPFIYARLCVVISVWAQVTF